MTYGWSKNEENFNGDFETRELALADARKENPECNVFWTGERHNRSAEDFFNVESLLEDMQVAADDEAGEVAEDWLPINTSAMQKEKDQLKAIICSFVNEHWPCRFWIVENILRHDITTKEPINA